MCIGQGAMPQTQNQKKARRFPAMSRADLLQLTGPVISHFGGPRRFEFSGQGTFVQGFVGSGAIRMR